MESRTVLCVDDSPTSLNVMAESLRDRGYNVMTAADGEDAMRQIGTQKPDLILLDIILPKKNGFQICRQLKTSPATRDIKVVLVSSKSQDTDRYWGLKQGADEYITKPFEPDQLVEQVEHQLGLAAAE